MSWNIASQTEINAETGVMRQGAILQSGQTLKQLPVTGKIRLYSGDSAPVTLRGRVGTDPDCTTTTHGSAAARFRLAVTRRGRDDAGIWHDLETTWYTVKAWNNLAQNVGFSIRKGQPVVVHGRLNVNQWEQAESNTRGTELVITASAIGHDLNAGISQFMRPARPASEMRASSSEPDADTTYLGVEENELGVGGSPRQPSPPLTADEECEHSSEADALTLTATESPTF